MTRDVIEVERPSRQPPAALAWLGAVLPPLTAAAVVALWLLGAGKAQGQDANRLAALESKVSAVESAKAEEAESRRRVEEKINQIAMSVAGIQARLDERDRKGKE